MDQDDIDNIVLGYNYITSLNDASWTGVTSLSKLKLDNNNIASFRDADWTGLTSLTYLDIEENPAAKQCHGSICLMYSIGKANCIINGISHCNICEARATVLPITYNVSTGEDLTLECIVILGGDPINKVTWLHNNKTINTELSKYTLGTVQRPSLTITSVQLEDEGTYTCVAQTSHGFVSESDNIKLNVETVNGGWGNWSAVTWTGCSTTCGNGSRQGYRSRTCFNPSPTYGSSKCEGLNTTTQTSSCNIKECPNDNTWVITVVAVVTGVGAILIAVLIYMRYNKNRSQYPTSRQDEEIYDQINEAEMRHSDRHDAIRLSILSYEHPYSQPLDRDSASYEQTFHPVDADQASTSREHAYQPLITDPEKNAHTANERDSYTDAMSGIPEINYDRGQTDYYTDAMSRIPWSRSDKELRYAYTDSLSELPQGDTARKRRNTY